jgi:hypothetical protein
MQRTKVRLTEPLFIGVAILAHSKVMMSRAVYRIKEYWESVHEVTPSFHYTDTDSVSLYLPGVGWGAVDRWMCDDRLDDRGPLLDTSSMPYGWRGMETDWLRALSGQLGLLKLEYVTSKDPTDGHARFDPIVEAQWLQSKMYSYVRLHGAQVARAKGVPSSALKVVGSHDAYRQVRETASLGAGGGAHVVMASSERLDTTQAHGKQHVRVDKVALKSRDTKSRVEQSGMVRRPFGYVGDRRAGVCYDLDARPCQSSSMHFVYPKTRQSSSTKNKIKRKPTLPTPSPAHQNEQKYTANDRGVETEAEDERVMRELDAMVYLPVPSNDNPFSFKVPSCFTADDDDGVDDDEDCDSVDDRDHDAVDAVEPWEQLCSAVLSEAQATRPKRRLMIDDSDETYADQKRQRTCSSEGQ